MSCISDGGLLDGLASKKSDDCLVARAGLESSLGRFVLAGQTYSPICITPDASFQGRCVSGHGKEMAVNRLLFDETTAGWELAKEGIFKINLKLDAEPSIYVADRGTMSQPPARICLHKAAHID